MVPKTTIFKKKPLINWIGHPPLPIHSTRHTHVAMLIEANWDMKSIADCLGHESPVTTMNVYAHISKKVEKRTIDSFDNYMENLSK